MQINYYENTGRNGCASYLIKVFTMTIAIIVSASFMQPHVSITSPWAGFLAAVMISALNIFLRPILLILTLPISMVTMGLFVFVVNAIIIWMTDKMMDSFYVENLGWAVLLALVISVVSYLLQLSERWMNKNKKKDTGYYDQNIQKEDTGFTEYEEVDDDGNPINK